MVITKLEIVSNRKVRVYIDDTYNFSLNPKEIKKYNLEQDEEINQEKLNNILENVILKRAKSKALNIVKYMDRTENEIREKLTREDYTDAIIDKTVDFLKEYNYINDYRYAQNYIQTRISKKSKRQVTSELIRKGVCSDLINQAFEEEFFDEDSAIRKILSKKFINAEDFNKEKKQKIYASLIRKGFNPSDVMRIIKDIEQNNDI